MANDGLVGFRRLGGVQGIQLVPDLASRVALSDQRRQDVQHSSCDRASAIRTGSFCNPTTSGCALERVFQLGSPGAAYFGGIVGADRCTKGKPCDLSRGIVTDRVAQDGEHAPCGARR